MCSGIAWVSSPSDTAPGCGQAIGEWKLLSEDRLSCFSSSGNNVNAQLQGRRACAEPATSGSCLVGVAEEVVGACHHGGNGGTHSPHGSLHVGPSHAENGLGRSHPPAQPQQCAACIWSCVPAWTAAPCWLLASSCAGAFQRHSGVQTCRKNHAGAHTPKLHTTSQHLQSINSLH